MDRTDKPIDEYTLAAYIAGTLPEPERAAVTAHLAENAESRELLQMAYRALEAVHPEEGSLRRPAAAPRPSVHRIDRPAARPASRRLSGVLRFAAAAAVVVGLGFGLRLAFLPETDELRFDAADETIDISVRGTLPALRLAWEPVENADRYRVVVWDLNRAETAAEYEVEQARLSDGGAEARDLNARLAAGQPYAVRVDAVDRTNRVLQSSESVEFTPER